MIAFDFEYIKPETIGEVWAAVEALKNEGLSYVYYAGGTELVTTFRQGKIKTDAVIDLKGIAEMTTIEAWEDEIVIGACATLNDVLEHEELSQLRPCIEPIADHTVRNALTVGGNLCGRLPYREAVLPLLGLDAKVVIVDGLERKCVNLDEVFDKRMKLEKNAYLYQIIVPKKALLWQFSERITGTVDVDYPTLHFMGMCDEEKVTLAISGYSSYPVYWKIERSTFESWENPEGEIMTHFKDEAKSDLRGDKAYRQDLLAHLISKMLREVAL